MNNSTPSPGPTIYLSSDPRVAGYNANVGTVAILTGTSTMLIKTGGASTAWSEVGGGGTPGIVFIAGQSNSIGQGDASTVAGGWSEVDSLIPMYQQSAPTGATPVWDVNYVGDLGPYATAAPNYGIEQTLAKTLYAKSCRVIVGKFGQSSTNLGAQWLPTGVYPAASPDNMFGQMCTYLDNLMAATHAPLLAFVWVQGESDTLDNTMTADYEVNLSAFMTAFRARYGAQVPIIIVQLNTAMTGLDAGNILTIRAAQAAYVASDARSALVSTAGLTSPAPNPDYNAADLMEIGRRCAAAIEPFVSIVEPLVTRDQTSLRYLPATDAEWTSFLSGVVGSPGVPTAIYNCVDLATGGDDTNGVQDLTVGSNWTSEAPPGWSRSAMTSPDGNGFPINSVAGPLGDPYAASHLIFAMVRLTGAPAATRDVIGMGGVAAYRGVQVTAARKYKLIDFSGGNSPTGVIDYGATVHPVFLQVDRTGAICRIITDRETITQNPYNACAVTSTFIGMGAAVALTGPVQILYMAVWRGAAAEMTAATIAGIMARISAGAPIT